ncbi:hypothetical protein NEDG_01993 [Nematocida displodere]|uniref:Uncharacterized protein n=1 Tax=Nematocida displodere TaxID=1805483 RepID=A0A177EG29_9MICR|nr:hypothetical protein NEDG_01993 [Nematocida displodere]
MERRAIILGLLGAVYASVSLSGETYSLGRADVESKLSSGLLNVRKENRIFAVSCVFVSIKGNPFIKSVKTDGAKGVAIAVGKKGEKYIVVETQLVKSTRLVAQALVFKGDKTMGEGLKTIAIFAEKEEVER